MASAATLRIRPDDLASLWERSDSPDLVLDADDGAIRSVRREDNPRGSAIASGIGKAVAAAPLAAGVVLSEVSRWD